ncbi:alpha/beta fold hydrolase [Nocardioides perillae]|uniref:Pimeloyl-ACP methyl ester carboxylesterase n=1 Tax=Nocardioides perillae TaxID=1119534 RepID=A0A7Y9USA7_9ACTN|nr:alpha/beta fold hydrolase [Nocardioides perillae]NYG55454.1 pimeloyl-ACP methyl ester carboxylesterase [Nocardioides perillae]
MSPLHRTRRTPRRARALTRLATALLLTAPVALVATPPASGGPAPAAASAQPAARVALTPRRRVDLDEVVSRPVAFRVTNTNRTAMPCVADGETYVLRGRLLAQRRELQRPFEMFRVLLHVHDVTTGRWFWNLGRHPAVDHARQLARRGHVSVVLDRLGYDSSGSALLDGSGTCFGAQADMLHQVVQQLRTGRCTARIPRKRAGHVVTVGHSVGAAIAQLEAATWRDVAGTVQMSWTNQGPTPAAVQEVGDQHQRCASGGDRVDERTNYAFFGATAEDFRSLLFATASPAVQATASRLRNPDPCGDALSLASLVATNNALAGELQAKLFLLYGGADALNAPEARAAHRASFANAFEIDEAVVEGAGSALPLEASAATTRRLLDAWLCRELSCPAD